jgi:xanthine permease XanP
MHWRDWVNGVAHLARNPAGSSGIFNQRTGRLMSEQARPMQPALRLGRDARVPPGILLTSATQHVLSLCAFLVFPIVVGRAAGIPDQQLPGLLSATLIGLGVANVLQASGRVGSGYLCPAGMTAAYLGPSLVAAKLGGLSAVLGMTVFAGALEALMSNFLHRLRALAPVELIGAVILLVGVTNAMTGFKVPPASNIIPFSDFVVAGATLMAMMVATLFAGERTKIFCALIGIVVGYLAAFATGALNLADLAKLAHLPPLALPAIPPHSWSLSLVLMIPFAVVAFAATVKQV